MGVMNGGDYGCALSCFGRHEKGEMYTICLSSILFWGHLGAMARVARHLESIMFTFQDQIRRMSHALRGVAPLQEPLSGLLKQRVP